VPAKTLPRHASRDPFRAAPAASRLIRPALNPQVLGILPGLRNGRHRAGRKPCSTKIESAIHRALSSLDLAALAVADAPTGPAVACQTVG
jgi:hypothetical protein